MPLSNEDNLRLNVLCAQPVKVIRINESSMLLTALTERGEARIELNPNSRHDAYLRDVREFLSEKFLGMPGGFPRHLARWTRMGMGQLSLDKMLLLGEPEAIVALAYSSDISAEQAEYAWWAMQSPEVARNLLKSPLVADSVLGKQLAQFLLEFLPFEERALNVVESVQLCLQASLLSAQEKAALWDRAKRKNPYFVGFLLAGPDAIPLQESAHPSYTECCDLLSRELQQENPFAVYFTHFLSAEGRKWLKSLSMALAKPTDPDVVIAMFISIDRYIKLELEPERGVLEIETARTQADDWCDQPGTRPPLNAVYQQLDSAQCERFKSMLLLAQLGENTLNRYFGGRDASGTVMRKHLKPLTTQINSTIKSLLNA